MSSEIGENPPKSPLKRGAGGFSRVYACDRTCVYTVAFYGGFRGIHTNFAAHQRCVYTVALRERDFESGSLLPEGAVRDT